MFFFLSLFFSFLCSKSQLTPAHIESLRESLLDIIINDPVNGRQQYDLIPQIVRLAFHDCVSDTCDGCINLDNSGNNGLSFPIEALEILYTDSNYGYNGQTWSEIMSRADLWMLSATLTLEYSATFDGATGPVPYIPYYYGRTDCSTSPYTTDLVEFPNAHSGLTDTLEYFDLVFDFTTRETVCILGAHTLGGGNSQNSGFIGRWVFNENVFNNDFYIDLISSDAEWIGEIIERGQNINYQFGHGNSNYFPVDGLEALMLNADMSLYRAINPNENGEVISCGSGNDEITFTYGVTSINSCPLSETSSIVEEYAASNELFISEFEQVFSEMIQHGEIDELSIVSDTPTLSPVPTTAIPSNAPTTSEPTVSPVPTTASIGCCVGLKASAATVCPQETNESDCLSVVNGSGGQRCEWSTDCE